jgi:hypothetical protein
MSTSAGLTQTVVAMREARAAEAPPARATSAHGAAPIAAPTPAPAAAASAGDAAARAVEPAATTVPVRSAFVPLLLGLTALLAVLGHQAWQLEQERRQLQAAQDGTAPRIEAATQLRRSLDLLAADTQGLADGGNAPARVLVEELRRRGITINTAAGTAAAAAPAASR